MTISFVRRAVVLTFSYISSVMCGQVVCYFCAPALLKFPSTGKTKNVCDRCVRNCGALTIYRADPSTQRNQMETTMLVMVEKAKIYLIAAIADILYENALNKKTSLKSIAGTVATARIIFPPIKDMISDVRSRLVAPLLRDYCSS